MPRERVASDPARIVEDDVEGTPSDDLGVELLETSRAGVAGIRERLAAGVLEPLVESGESVARHVDLSADLERLRGGFGKRQRDRLYGADVLRHVVADDAVAASRGADEPAVLVAERHRDTVDLGLDEVCEALDGLPDELVEVEELVLRVGLVEGLHRRVVADLLEGSDRRSRDAPGRGIRVEELRVALLEVQQLVVEEVVVSIAYDGLRLDVVEAVVPVYLAAQPVDSGLCIRIGHRFRHGHRVPPVGRMGPASRNGTLPLPSFVSTSSALPLSDMSGCIIIVFE